MDIVVAHAISGRLRCRINAKQLQAYRSSLITQALTEVAGVLSATVNPRTGSILLQYDIAVTNQLTLLQILQALPLETFPLEEFQPTSTTAGWSFIRFILVKLLLPVSIRPLYTLFRSTPYIRRGLRSLLNKKMDIELLDSVAISVLLGQRNYRSASLLMTLLKTGDYLEEWAKERSKTSLANTLALNIGQVWIKNENTEEQIPYSKLKIGDQVVVRAGSVIPVDGEIVEGEAMVNESSFTGEPLPVMRTVSDTVFAGTVLDEGELLVLVRSKGDDTRFQKVIQLIQDSESMKADIEHKANEFADKIVPFNFAVSGLTYAVTRNPNKTAATLSVDYSCAIKLSTPLVFLATMREALTHGVFFKGGISIEKLSKIDTIVFDKTGTLTQAKPKVVKVTPYNGYTEQEVIKIAACLEEHFPHPMATAVVKHAEEQNIEHKEAHSSVKYIVAHGIATSYDDKHTIIGSRHFIHDDENIDVSIAKNEEDYAAEQGYSLLYLAHDQQLIGVLFIQDPVREEAKEVISMLKTLGIKRFYMLTGDNINAAKRVANQLGIDSFRADMKPDDKAEVVRFLKSKGCNVAVVGDGMNDSPAMSMADLGIAMNEGADIAQAVADIMLKQPSLYPLVIARLLSQKAVQKINYNNKSAVGINSVLMILSILGVLPETSSVFLHNLTTIGISLHSMRNILPVQA